MLEKEREILSAQAGWRTANQLGLTRQALDALVKNGFVDRRYPYGSTTKRTQFQYRLKSKFRTSNA